MNWPLTLQVVGFAMLGLVWLAPLVVWFRFTFDRDWQAAWVAGVVLWFAVGLGLLLGAMVE